MWNRASRGTPYQSAGLDVVKDRGRAAKGAAVDVGVDFVIYLESKLGKEDENTIVVPVISTAEDAAVNAEAEEGETKAGDVVDLTDDHLLTPHVDGNNALACNEDVGVVGERDVLVVHAMLGNEALV